MVIKREDLICPEAILAAAADHEGITLSNGKEREATSVVLATVPLANIRQALIRANYRVDNRPRDQIITVCDTLSVENIPGWAESNYWNFQTREGRPLDFTFAVKFQLSPRHRAVLCRPAVDGNFISPGNQKAHERLWKLACDQQWAELPRLPVADQPMIFWEDIGFAGIRTIESLMSEFQGSNHSLQTLAAHGIVQFGLYDETLRGCFLRERQHHELLTLWGKELKEYQSTLRPAVHV